MPACSAASAEILCNPVFFASNLVSKRTRSAILLAGITHMLTELKLKALRPRDSLYRVADQRGLAVEVPPTVRCVGAIAMRAKRRC